MEAIAPRSLRQIVEATHTDDLLVRGVYAPALERSLEQKLDLIVGYIQQVQEQFERLDNRDRGRCVVVLGNTGCGKSTLINYLAGCKMRRVEAIRADIRSPAPYVVDVDAASPVPRQMRIHHEMVYQESFPEIRSLRGRIYYECPSPLSLPLGAEINLANIAGIRRVVFGDRTSGAWVRLVILVHYWSLVVDRIRGLRNIMDVVCRLFGTLEILRIHRASILVGITHIPERCVMEDQRDLEELKRWISDVSGEVYFLNNFEREVVREFAQNLFIYDPLDEGEFLKYSGALGREELLERIDAIPPLENPEVSWIVPNGGDAVALENTCDEVEKRLCQILAREDYEGAAFLIDCMRRMQAIEYPYVERLLGKCQNHIIMHFAALASNLRAELASTLESTPLSQYITNELAAFSQEDRERISGAIDRQNLIKPFITHADEAQEVMDGVTDALDLSLGHLMDSR